MKFIISEEERKRILNIHENATKNSYLKIITESTSHPNSKEPYKPSDTEIDNDIEAFKTYDDFLMCIVKSPRTMGWYKGYLGYTDDDGVDTQFTYWTPNKTSGLGMLFYDFVGNSMKQTGDPLTLDNYKLIGDVTCNSRPFSKPATDETQLLQGKGTLRIGDNNELVKKLQDYLVKLGKLDQSKVTGKFDKETKKAVEDLQGDETIGVKIKVDGVVGKNTWNKIMNSSSYEANNASGVETALQKSQQSKLEKTSPLFGDEITKDIQSKMNSAGLGQKNTGSSQITPTETPQNKQTGTSSYGDQRPQGW